MFISSLVKCLFTFFSKWYIIDMKPFKKEAKSLGILDIYLHRNGKKRRDILDNKGKKSVSSLLTGFDKNIGHLSIDDIKAISKVIQKNEGVVVNELLNLEKENPMFEAFNIEDLIYAFEINEPYILIRGNFNKEVSQLLKTQLTETETLGLELGSAGTINILAEGFSKLSKLLNKDHSTTEVNKYELAEEKLKQYKSKINSKQEVLLYLKQIDF